jgi:GNAT superfamily N-acetyltransferase
MTSTQMDVIRNIEEISANAWRPAVCQQVWGWQLGYSGGTSRRVNSVLSHHMIGPVRLKERITLVDQFYHSRNRPVVFKISPATLPVNLPQKLLKAGYEIDAPTNIQVVEINHLIEASVPPKGHVQITTGMEETWFKTYTEASGYAPESLPIRSGILSRISAQSCFVLLHSNGAPAATGLGICERGWLGVYCMVTRPEARRQGYANQVMHVLAEWAKQQGAARAYLQVMEDNPPALELYRKLGFTKLYDYYYLVRAGIEKTMIENQ